MRQKDLAAICANPASPLLDQYGATLLVVGSYERNGALGCEIAEWYPSEPCANLPGVGWERVLSACETAVYLRIEIAG